MQESWCRWMRSPGPSWWKASRFMTVDPSEASESKEPSRFRTSINVAGIGFELSSSSEMSRIGFAEVYSLFGEQAETTISIDLKFEDLPHPAVKGAREVFASESLWSLYETDESYLFLLRAMDDYCPPYRLAVVDKDLARGEIISDPAGRYGRRGDRLPDPLEYPLGEALTITLLSSGLGVMVHACGIEVDGDGYLLLGHSGCGKTTLTELFRRAGHRVLNDDRIVLKLVDGYPWIYGTPWHGDCDVVSPRGVPLKKMFVIEHASANSTRMSIFEAVSMVLARSFSPLWSLHGMNFTMGFIQQAVEIVRPRHLGFVPQPEVVDFLRCDG